CGRVGYLHLGHLLALGTPAELQRRPDVTPPGTHRIEITPAPHGITTERDFAADITHLLERLRNQPGVLQATIFGQAIHALVNDDRTAENLGLNGATVRRTEPSLEDVFVSLARAQDEREKT